MMGFRGFIFINSFMALMFICLAGQVFADNPDYQGSYARLMGGFNFAADSDFDGNRPELFPSGEASFETGAVAGLAIGYRFNRNFAADLDYAYRSNDIDRIENTAGASIADGGDLASVAIMANTYYHFDFTETWSPYIGVGVGFLQEIDSDVQLLKVNSQKDLAGL